MSLLPRGKSSKGREESLSVIYPLVWSTRGSFSVHSSAPEYGVGDSFRGILSSGEEPTGANLSDAGAAA